jgi:hypothetical protein
VNDHSSTPNSVPASDLIGPSLELHWAAQLLASAGQTFAEIRPDDSHRAMAWDTHRRAFVSSPFAGAYPFRVGLRPEDLTLLLLDRTDEPLSVFPLSGTTLDEGYEWLTLGMATYMGGAPPVIERPEFGIPEHAVGHGAPFSSPIGPEFAAMGSLFDGAHDLLSELLAEDPDASPIRCWPHHFDIATLLTVETTEDGDASKTVGVGFAPMGGGYESWYWYVTPWPYPADSALPSLSSAGEWHTEGWTGAVLTGVEVDAIAQEDRTEVVRAFLEEAVAAARKALSV